jgi:site-specific DNA recombinase
LRLAWAGRTSTYDQQDPSLSLPRQLASSREALPPGWVIVAHFYDVESGRLDLDARGQGTAHQAFDLRIPRDGGITDLLGEARRPDRRFDAVICESIDRIARRTYYGAKIEHELEQAGVALFAADEPILLSGKRATAILTRRVKQGVAEWYVLEMLEKSWDGACEHTRQGWNVGRPPYGYQAEPIPHPVPARRAEGKTKTRLRPDPVRAAVVRQIFAWRVTERLGYRAIAERLSQDRDRYPPPVSPDPARSRDCWGYSAVLEVLRNPKYTGYMVWNRRASKKGGRHNPPEAWIWSPQPTHEPIVSRELFAAAQPVAPQRRGSRSGAGLNRHPQTRRSYPLRSLVTCELCGRKMRGKLRRKARRDYLYYACEPPRSLGRQVAADRQPEHPASVLVRGDVLLGGVLEFFALRLFSPQRRALLAQDLPKVADGEVTAWEARVQALRRTLADLQGRQARLVRTLEERDDPGGTLFEQVARRLGELDRQQQTKLAELRAMVAERPQADAQSVDLLELLPLLTSERLAAAPEPLLRTLFERFQLQVRYHRPQNRATVRVALSDDSLDGLLASLDDIEGGEARQDPAISSAGAVSLAGGAPRRLRTGEPGQQPLRANRPTAPLQPTLTRWRGSPKRPPTPSTATGTSVGSATGSSDAPTGARGGALAGRSDQLGG